MVTSIPSVIEMTVFCQLLLRLLSGASGNHILEVSKRNLSCYECLDSRNDPSNSDSRRKLDEEGYIIDLPCQMRPNESSRKCTKEHKYCRTQYVRVSNLIYTFQRSCESKCKEGVQGQRFYLTQYTHTMCCQEKLCNDQIVKPSRSVGLSSNSFITICALLLTIFVFMTWSEKWTRESNKLLCDSRILSDVATFLCLINYGTSHLRSSNETIFSDHYMDNPICSYVWFW